MKGRLPLACAVYAVAVLVLRRAASGFFLAIVVVTIAALARTPSAALAANDVAVTSSPAQPHVNEPTTFTFTGSSDRPARLHVTYISYVMGGGGGACSLQPMYRAVANPPPEIVSGQPVDGPFSLQTTYTFTPPVLDGWICIWLASPDSITPGTEPVAPPTATSLSFYRPVVPPLVSTRVRSTFPATATRSRLIVSSRITSRGARPKGTCILERRSTDSWLYVSRFIGLDGHGRCRITVALRETGRQRFRVTFRPAAGFKASTSAASSIMITRWAPRPRTWRTG